MPAFDAGIADQVIERLAGELEQSFVFPEVGKRYASTLRANRASGRYRRLDTAEAFAEAVTSDLQAVHQDRHLKLRPPEAAEPGAQPGPVRGPSPGNAITKAGWLADGVAYIDFAGFPGNEATLTALRDFLARHGDAETLIIDARGHRGGGLAEMDMMFPLLFQKEQVLVKMDTRLAVDQRGGNPFEEGGTIRKEQAPEGVVRRVHLAVPAPAAGKLRQARVFLLTSGRTASAAEHLSLSLKRTGRATLIGETTRGAGHYGFGADLGGGYSAFIPVGRTFDPDTGEGWEGVGVKPDVAVPADQALDEALKRAGVKPGAARDLASL
ncbi:MAG TPA: S41 family peptidase [Allosphingosinicella sp.]|jgi:C-terminal processing protease CtpA/Prc|uniref:S41 family peptidase n=1 Tax=Allosphingosinicella sp. TaxID=2823234 RepID=UPI002F279D57